MTIRNGKSDIAEQNFYLLGNFFETFHQNLKNHKTNPRWRTMIVNNEPIHIKLGNNVVSKCSSKSENSNWWVQNVGQILFSKCKVLLADVQRCKRQEMQVLEKLNEL